MKRERTCCLRNAGQQTTVSSENQVEGHKLEAYGAFG
jgi:hypothetical protein